MGWFWSDASSTSTPAPAAPPSSSAIPPSCPMHKPEAAAPPPPPPASSGCPVRPSKSAPAPSTTSPPSECPVKPSSASPASSDAPHTSDLNPLNFMFSNLSQSKAPGQKLNLPTEREVSTIPRGDTAGNWEYPSPQQMYNAMRRKGYDDAPEDAIESMVAVHNWLNEGAWGEITEWEKTFRHGTLGHLFPNTFGKKQEEEVEEEEKSQLLRFEGRRNDVTPKAKLYGILGMIAPETFGGPEPFDRHDWYVKTGNRETRYVIDYYSGGEEHGMPVFFLDVRPACDRPGLVAERICRWAGEKWENAVGADVRRRRQEEVERGQREGGLKGVWQDK